MKKIGAMLCLLGIGCTQPQPLPPTSSPVAPSALVTLLSQDFRAQLPPAAATRSGQPRTTILPLGNASEPTLRLTLKVLDQTLIESVQVELQSNPGSHVVRAELGQPTNSGTSKTPRMSVPLKVTWASSNSLTKTSRTDLWTLSADQGCVKSP